MERVGTMLEPVDKYGLDEIFKLLTRHALELGLQPVTIEFIRQTLQTLMLTLANMDHDMSDACRRRSAVISAQFTEVSRQYAVDFTARAADPGVSEEDLTAIFKELDALVGLEPVKNEVHRATEFRAHAGVAPAAGAAGGAGQFAQRVSSAIRAPAKPPWRG